MFHSQNKNAIFMKGYVLNFPLRLMVTDGKTIRIALLHCMPQYRTSGSSMRLCKTVSRSSLEMEQSPSSENSTTSEKKTPKCLCSIARWEDFFFTSQVVSYTVKLFLLLLFRELPGISQMFLISISFISNISWT